LSETLRFSSRDIKGWLERETGSVFIPVHTRAQKSIDEMHRTVENLAEVSRTIMDNSAKEIEKRNTKTYRRARAMNKLARLFYDRMRHIDIPEKISYESFGRFTQETQKAFAVTDVDIRNWFPRISPFFILDRRRFLTIFERAKLSLKEIQNFQSKEYVKTRTLEETFQLVDELLTLEQQLASLNERKVSIEDERALVEAEMNGMQLKMTELQSAGSISQLSQTGTEIDALVADVKHSLRHMQKPFIKLQSLATHGEGSGLTPEEVGKLEQYIENPFEALSTESMGLPLLRQIMLKMERSIREGKLKLKPEKIRKAKQTLDDIVNKNCLAGLHQKCRDARSRRAQLSTSEEVTVMQQNLSQLQKHLDDLKRKNTAVESQLSIVRKSCDEILEKIRKHKSEIERNIFSFMNKTVRIE
jgi:hypothetical protein